jgi:hypothetical protein
MKRLTAPAILLLAIALIIPGCAAYKNISSALTNLGKLQFKLNNVSNMRVSGIDISRATSKSSLGIADAARLAQAFAQGQLPVDFTLNVLALNPNTGTGGTQATPLYLRKMDWTLLIDNRTTINGSVNQRLEIPGNGQSTTIPLTISLDLFKFFKDKGFEDVANLAFALGGASGSASRLKLSARVSIETPLGVYDYPNEITIVDREFTSK